MILLFLFNCTFIYINSTNSNKNSTINSEEITTEDITSFNYYYYYGSLHNHTNVSDGVSTPKDAYIYARDIGKLDFFGLADHAGQISSTEWSDIKTQANAYNKDGSYVTFYGFEWSHSTYGHVAVINSDDYCTESNSTTNNFTKLLNWLSTRDCIAFFNHPGRQDSTGVEFNHFTDSPSDKFVGMELWNKGDTFSDYYYNNGYYSNDNNLSFFDEALTRGWKIGASGADDNHNGTYGTLYPYRMCILATSLTRSSLLEALKARRFFSTLDKNLKLYFEIGGYVMGSTINPGNYTAMIQLSDNDNEIFKKVELLKNGAIIYSWDINETNPTLTYSITGNSNDYFYIRVKQADNDEAISSPIFISNSSSSSSSSSSEYLVIERRVTTGNDDAEERQNGTMYLNSSDLELIYDTDIQKVGIRFTNITIPKNSVIQNAYIQFKVDETSAENTNLVIKGHNIDNSTTFSSNSNDISNRIATNASVLWSPPAWNIIGEQGENQRTPDIKSIIQEIINRDGWVTGNSIIILITGTGKRVAKAYEGEALGAPILKIVYK